MYLYKYYSIHIKHGYILSKSAVKKEKKKIKLSS